MGYMCFKDNLNTFDDIKRIFSQFTNSEELKDEFGKSYRAFARKLRDAGHRDESTFYMSICMMYGDLIDRPSELIAHEDFFKDFYGAFDELLFTKFNNPREYGQKFNEFCGYWWNMFCYFGNNLVIPSDCYDENTLAQLINYWHKGV